MRRAALRAALVGLALAGLAYTRRADVHQWLFDLTGEENSLSQWRGAGQLLGDLLRPALDLQPEVPIAHNGVNPFGINTFLEQEVEPSKRERQVQLIADAGFHWLRQEFPWADIEIGGKNSFEDCRNGPCISAWDKYDHIVSLAEQNQLALLVRLSSPPDWSRAGGSDRGAFAPPDRLSDFADYAAAVAQRYQGRVLAYQVWNEPNIYPEWGNQPADPEAYTRLLCAAYEALHNVDPDIVVVSGALAPTAELGAPVEAGANNLNDFIFLERMYAAGAQPCFDVLSVQGYGLWSGPTDHRRRAFSVNYGRNQFNRDQMVRHGDAHKAIWIAEMNWNALPAGSPILANFGQVTDEQQARYAPLAYQRAQSEWPWVGLNAFWFFKRASDAERDLAWYYFRMAEPDFTLLPVYDSLKAYMHQTPVMSAGWFQEDHWAVSWDGDWDTVRAPEAVLGAVKVSAAAGATVRFSFDGTDLVLGTRRGPDGGSLGYRVDDGTIGTITLESSSPAAPAYVSLAQGLAPGRHTIEIDSLNGGEAIDGFIVRRAPARAGFLFVGVAAALGLLWYLGSKWPRRHMTAQDAQRGPADVPEA